MLIYNDKQKRFARCTLNEATNFPDTHMTSPFLPRCAAAALTAYFFILLTSHAEQQLNAASEEIVQQAEKLITSSHLNAGLRTRVDLQGLKTVTRQFNKSYPFSKNAFLRLSTAYGEIHVDTWTEGVVRILAEIRAGASDETAAANLAENITIRVEIENDGLTVTSVYPDARPAGRFGYEIDYRITVPQDAQLVVDDTFADTYIDGLKGSLALDARYGIVELRNLAGDTRVRAQGEFPFLVHGLTGGGVFTLRSSLALFEDISGTVRISNHLGRTEVKGLGENTTLDLRSESAQAHVYLPSDGDAYLTATTVFGTIESTFSLETSVQGNTVIARRPNAESTRQVSLHTSFGTLYLYEEGTANETAVLDSSKGQLFKNAETYSYEVSNGLDIHINAIVGDVTVEGIDEQKVYVTVEKFVRLESADKTQFAMEAMNFTVKEGEGRLEITSRLLEDMEALGCYAYRANLTIRCPRSANVTVTAEDGTTSILGTSGVMTVEQQTGLITVEHAQGKLLLTNHKGDLRVSDCAGPVQSTAGFGSVNIQNVLGPIEFRGTNTQTIIDAPHDKVFVHVDHGDVVILAMEGIKGDYDISVDDGDLSMVIAPESDASIWTNVTGGVVYSSIPLSGSIEGDRREFHGRVGAGLHKVTLTAKGGNVVLD